MTVNTQDAIKILWAAEKRVLFDHDMRGSELKDALATLYNAIRHLAYPDRDAYPKRRDGTKVRPIMQVGHRWLK